MLQRKEAQVK